MGKISREAMRYFLIKETHFSLQMLVATTSLRNSWVLVR